MNFYALHFQQKNHEKYAKFHQNIGTFDVLPTFGTTFRTKPESAARRFHAPNRQNLCCGSGDSFDFSRVGFLALANGSETNQD
jgi:hypothetical protein